MRRMHQYGIIEIDHQKMLTGCSDASLPEVASALPSFHRVRLVAHNSKIALFCDVAWPHCRKPASLFIPSIRDCIITHHN
jgi:hypothetical protein